MTGRGRPTLLAAGHCAAGHEITGEASVVRSADGSARCRECVRLRDLRRRLDRATPRRSQLDVGRCSKAGHELIEGSFRVYSYQRPHGIQTVVICLECARLARNREDHSQSA